LYAQPLLPDITEEIAVDLFAGGGGWSSAFEQATGQMVSVAINHDAACVALHEENHPQTEHHKADVFEVDPRFAVRGRKVGWLHASPDCTGFSAAKGAAPRREKDRKRRCLAWVVCWWAGAVQPRIISLENVLEFTRWTRLIGKPDNLRECKKTAGRRFKKFVRILREKGYTVEWREIRACDYGAPTIRKRLALIARRDGKPIVWPEATHGHPDSAAVKAGRLKPWSITGDHIDWTIPMLSIFATPDEAKAFGQRYGMPAPRRPLKDKSMARIARGIDRFVLKSPKPYLRVVEGGKIGASLSVELAHGDESATAKRWGKSERSLDEPTTTISCSGGPAIVSGCLIPRYGERAGQAPRCISLEEPYPTVVPDGNGGSLMAAGLSTYYGAKSPTDARGASLFDPIPTIPTENRFALVASLMARYNAGFAEGNSGDGESLENPSPTILTKGPHQALVAVGLNTTNNSRDPHYGAGEPANTIVSDGARHNLFAVHVKRDFGTSTGHGADEPIGTLTTDGGGKATICASFLQKYYGTGEGQTPHDPLHTIPTHDRFGLVNLRLEKQRKVQTNWGELVMVEAGDYVVSDIGMRMLWPHELYALQGFRPGYKITCQVTITDGRGRSKTRWLTKTEQVRMVGNSVSPPPFEAIIKANAPEWNVRARSGRAA
jgi:DNA (cytosine-5)-methyltransferase 1